IDVELGGRRLMRITDDGHGMHRDDAILAFERHATSKIRTLEDLAAIGTLGFRGEALASIASVAKVELVTKTEDDAAAARVQIEGGKLIDIKNAARDRGTTISVRDLFFNTPARRKFMRSEATENYHLASIVTHYALAHPEIAFTLTNNGREVLQASPAKDLRERAFQLFGSGLLDSLLPVAGGREHFVTVSGFVSAPRERRTNRDAQYFFVNRRYVRDKTIAGGLLEGYRSVLPHGVYPVAFLFLDTPLEEIDVNVHPAKTEIRFRRTEAVKEVIAETVRAALAKAGIVAEPLPDAGIRRHDDAEPEPPASAGGQTIADPGVWNVDLSEPDAVAEFQSVPSAAAGGDLRTSTSDGVARRKTDTVAADSQEGGLAASVSASVAGGLTSGTSETGTYEQSRIDFESSAFEPEIFSSDFEQTARSIAEAGKDLTPATAGAGAPVLPPLNSAAQLARPVEVRDVSSGKIKPMGQLHDSFIIAVDDEGLLLIDQHVAHERILFDKFSRSEAARTIESQNLLLPETIDLSPAQSEAFGLIETDLASLGFNVMRLSGRTIAIKSVPTDLPVAEARNLFAEILDTVDAEKRGGAKATLRADIAASLACKAAVKINMKLTHEKMQWLIDRLLLTTSPTTCPHGRPVILRLTMKDIERGFHRT
ncbi:MAG TPA: DNA mismatch repair endonuclease MutL, partial [Pyrinomonadaceae bacterium]|nr:DNA mismatch repair endonuclease MutL [Pyrinomonadaceae bacterium]